MRTRVAPALGAALAWCGLLASCSRSLEGGLTLGDRSPDASTDVNACGGGEELTLGGLAAWPGEACGPCGDGVVVCASRDRLVCLGASEMSMCADSGSTNACEGAGPLLFGGEAASPGDPCGPCHDGALVCAGTASLNCVGARPASACAVASSDAGADGSSVDGGTDAEGDAGADSSADATADAAADAAPPPCTIPSSAYTAPAPALPPLPPEVRPTSDSVSYVNLATNDLVYDPFDGLLYASVPSSSGANGNSIAIIDPASATVLSTVFIGSEPGALALSDDGAALWVALTGAAAVRRFDTKTRTAGFQFSLPPATTPEKLAVLPGTEDSVVVLYDDDSFGLPAMAVFDNGVPRTVIIGDPQLDEVVSTYSPSLLYGRANAGSDVYRICVNSKGLFVDETITAFAWRDDLAFSHGVIYGPDDAYDVASDSVIGTYSAKGLVAPDYPTGRVFYLPSSSPTNNGLLTAIDMATFASAGTESFALSPFQFAYSLVRWGRYGFAFRVTAASFNPAAVWIVRSTLIPPQP